MSEFGGFCMIDHMEIRGADEPSIGLHPLDVETLTHVFDILIY